MKGYNLGCKMHDFHDSFGLYVSVIKVCFPVLVESSTVARTFLSKEAWAAAEGYFGV